jgi:hypothetical protein
MARMAAFLMLRHLDLHPRQDGYDPTISKASLNPSVQMSHLSFRPQPQICFDVIILAITVV